MILVCNTGICDWARGDHLRRSRRILLLENRLERGQRPLVEPQERTRHHLRQAGNLAFGVIALNVIDEMLDACRSMCDRSYISVGPADRNRAGRPSRKASCSK